MPVSDYTSAVGGGLKLKGVKDGGVKKAKKHKKTKDKPTDDQLSGPNDEKTEDSAVQAASSDEKSIEVDESSEFKGVAANKYGKTEAQLRHEERRRQMMEERSKREGVKTHKERVEELNKYLSRLSEHHDMPRIGPG